MIEHKYIACCHISLDPYKNGGGKNIFKRINIFYESPTWQDYNDETMEFKIHSFCSLGLKQPMQPFIIWLNLTLGTSA